jgi:hypothetical protein
VGEVIVEVDPQVVHDVSWNFATLPASFRAFLPRNDPCPTPTKSNALFSAIPGARRRRTLVTKRDGFGQPWCARSAADVRVRAIDARRGEARLVVVAAGWKREDVTAQTVASGLWRQRVWLIEHDLCTPSTNRQPAGGITGKPAVDSITEQSSVFEEDEQRVGSARHHPAGFLGARARVEFPVGAAGSRQEAVSVGNGEVAPQPYGQTHTVDERIVTHHAVIASHADTIPEPAYSAIRSAAADHTQ